jgi:hypothetical protein
MVCVLARDTRVSLIGGMTKKFTHSISCQLPLKFVAVRPAIDRIALRDCDLAKQPTRASPLQSRCATGSVGWFMVPPASWASGRLAELRC